MRTVRRLTWLLAGTALLLPAADRVMVADNIYVGPDESIDDVVCIACSIHVEGKVRDAVAIAGSVLLEGEASGDVVVLAGGLKVPGSVGGDAVVIAGGFELFGAVVGDVVAVMGGVRLHPGAAVDGDVVAVMGGVSGAEDARVGGELHSAGGPGPLAVSAMIAIAVLLLLLAFAIWPLIAYITYSILGERRAMVLRDTVDRRAGMSFLLGLAIWISWFVLSVALFWLPAGDAPLWIAYGVVAAVGYVGICLWVGGGMIRSGNPKGTLVLGAVLVSFIQAVPIIGWIAWWVFAMMAMGAAALSGFGSSPDWLLRRTETEAMTRPART